MRITIPMVTRAGCGSVNRSVYYCYSPKLNGLMKLSVVVTLCLLALSARAQLVESTVDVAPQFRSVIDTGHKVMLPSGYTMSVYWAGKLQRPRFMAIRPGGRLFVADMNASSVWALIDTNNDGVADSIYAATPQVDTAHSIAFFNDALYVAEPGRVRKFRDVNGDGYYEAEDPFITGIGDTGYYNHFTRTILFDRINSALYVSVGASCNACREGDPERATILRFNLDGTGRRVYASGLRNAIGLALQTNRSSGPPQATLWATNADRDALGADDPPEIITQVQDGGFYGWPFAYGDHKWDDFQATTEYQAMQPLTPLDSLRVSQMQVGTVQIHAHSTPMAIMFYRDENGNYPYALVAIHGSSQGGRKVAVGYKVVKLWYDDSIAEGWRVDDFLTGFLTDSVNYKYWGRPCGLAEDTAGNVYLSSDQGIPVIYRISKLPSGVSHHVPAMEASISFYPNPASEKLIVSFANISGPVTVDLLDPLGRVVQTIFNDQANAENRFELSTSDLSRGVYAIRLLSLRGEVIKKVVVLK